ncbi:MAG: RNA polymerase sigma factor, partial [Pseudomonadota bacterium]
PGTVARALPAMLPRLRRVALRLARSADRADDLVQAACLRAIERAAQFSGRGSLEGWVLSILMNTWFNHCRAERLRLGQGQEEAADVLVYDGPRAMEARLTLSDVAAAIDALPAPQRAVLLLTCRDGLSYREAAEREAVPIGTIMSRLAAARRALAHLRGDVPE